MKRNIILPIILIFSGIYSVSAYSYNYYDNYGSFCTQDAYVCPNGSVVGRTGYNCQFICPSSTNNNNSYYYTSGCYTYYYNGYTRTTSIINYNCSNTNTGYVAYSYSTPFTYTYQTSPYYTYSYYNGAWYPSYTQNYYNNYDNYYDYYYNNYRNIPTPRTNCYYLYGQYTCQ